MQFTVQPASAIICLPYGHGIRQTHIHDLFNDLRFGAHFGAHFGAQCLARFAPYQTSLRSVQIHREGLGEIRLRQVFRACPVTNAPGLCRQSESADRAAIPTSAVAIALISRIVISSMYQPASRRYLWRRWKVRNLIIESINLGKVYRNEFQAAVRDRNGDLDAVIDIWATTNLDT